MDARLKWFELKCFSSNKDSAGKPNINYVTVFEHPGYTPMNLSISCSSLLAWKFFFSFPFCLRCFIFNNLWN
ncbi:hypothetical protein LINPERPRIM_LOCUS20994 [Linum perenne]